MDKGYVVLENFFNTEQLNNMLLEFDRIFIEHKNKIELLDKEGCSNDERIFNAEKYSNFLKDIITNNPYFNNFVQKYTNRVPSNKKMLINLLTYEDGKIKNSGAGWHRDNHDCQFKVIIYLSDVTTENGNFQFITNSSKRHIGYPTPRTPNYNTRFSDETIYKLLNDHKECEIVNICGKKGTCIMVDTTYIHRGNIIKNGERKAITQYYF